jgi:hypothetical protein
VKSGVLGCEKIVKTRAIIVLFAKAIFKLKILHKMSMVLEEDRRKLKMIYLQEEKFGLRPELTFFSLEVS